MKLELTITMDNAAFDPDSGAEAARILRKLADKIDGNQLEDGGGWPLVDFNGNRVGTAEVVE